MGVRIFERVFKLHLGREDGWGIVVLRFHSIPPAINLLPSYSPPILYSLYRPKI